MTRTLSLLFLAPALLTHAAGCTPAPMPPVAAAVHVESVAISGPEADARAILAARDTLNMALRDRDAAPFGRLWLENVHIVSGDGSVRIGRDTSVKSFARRFADSTFVSGLRSPERVDVGVTADGGGQAAEAGRWVWRTRRQSEGVTEARGRYLVFWRRTADGWRIRSEHYVTTACVSGPRCVQTR